MFQSTRSRNNIPPGTLNNINVFSISMPLDTLTKFRAIGMYSNHFAKLLWLQSWRGCKPKIAFSEVSHGIERFREVFSYLDEASGVAQHLSAESYQFLGSTELGNYDKYKFPYWDIEFSLLAGKVMMVSDPVLFCIFQDLMQCEYLIDLPGLTPHW